MEYEANEPKHIKVRGAKVHNLKNIDVDVPLHKIVGICLLYTSPSPRDMRRSRMPSSA